jgi:hypothetical protein
MMVSDFNAPPWLSASPVQDLRHAIHQHLPGMLSDMDDNHIDFDQGDRQALGKVLS